MRKSAGHSERSDSLENESVDPTESRPSLLLPLLLVPEGGMAAAAASASRLLGQEEVAVARWDCAVVGVPLLMQTRIGGGGGSGSLDVGGGCGIHFVLLLLRKRERKREKMALLLIGQ